jgi:hypothetical protein
MFMRVLRVWVRLTAALCVAGAAAPVLAQETGAATRQALIEQEQAAKATQLHPYEPNKAERFMNRLEYMLSQGGRRWHPYLRSAYSGGGFTLGVGRTFHVSPYNTIDARGSYTILGFKRAEVEFLAPRMFHRRASLSLLGGWREATEARFFGLGMATTRDDKMNFDFRQPYGSATFQMFPARRIFMFGGGVELTRWSEHRGEGRTPSVDSVYTPATLPGVGARTTYLHTQGTVGIDWRTSPGYTRRGGYYGVTVHDYADRDDKLGFRRVDYEVIQHFPILREAWVISLFGGVSNTFTKDGQDIPYFLMPYVGGGSTLRGYQSGRFRERNRIFMKAEWRIMNNRFFDTAFFYDAGKVTARRSDLDFDGLKSNYGVGLRFHSPFDTPLRIELARGREGLAFIFSFSPAF